MSRLLSQPGIGDGQTWQDKTAARAVATQYTNNTGRNILVLVVVSAASATYSYFYMNGTVVQRFLSTGTGMSYLTMMMLVPPGKTYQVNSTSLISWWELT